MVRQRDPDSVFDIHVDPSCLSTPMDEAPPPTKTPEAGDEQEHETKDETEDISVEQMLQDTVDELQSQQDKATATALEDDTAGDESILTTTTDTADEGTEADTESRRSSIGDRRISGRTDALIQAAARAVVDQIERQRQEDAQPYLAGSVMESAINDRSYTDASDASFMTETETEHHDEDSRRESFVSESQATEDRRESIISESQATEDRRESIVSESQATEDRRESVVSEQAAEDRRESAVSEKSSISEKVGVDKRDSIISESQASVNRHDSIVSQSQTSNPRDSLTSHPERAPSAQGSVIQTPSRISLADDSSRRGSNTPSHARTDSDDLDLDRDHDRDSEVFSDRSHSHSARSSLGSFEDHRSYKGDNLESAFGRRADAEARSPRVSDFSQYDDREDFVPTIRGNPRPPFRTPSDVRALQMAVSPPPSVFAGVSPRSSKRHHLPTISRLGSPTPSIQYSPKGRTTPSRLKPRKTTPPLVLLHATILPLRWPWGDVLEDAPSDTLTPDAKTLRETWRFLHDRLGDTVCERGVLLPHPQGDYEILEERLLDALELPLRRRARILECGHYVGPANELTLTEDLDSDNDDASDFGGSRYSRQGSSAFMSPSRSTLSLSGPQTHWCATCRHDIKFEALGPGKVFRVKVYASNGLMKAGAWSACWKEMERVDVEIEPIIKGPELQDELETLATRQQEAAERAAEEEDAAQAAAELDESIIEETYVGEHHQLPPSSPPAAVEGVPASPSPGSSISRHDQVEERRMRDEARMREIYGDEPEQEPVLPEAASPQPSDSVPLPSAESYANQHASPTSPSEEARARRDARRSSRHRESSDLKNATLPELLLEAVRVMLQDRKNVALVLLSCLVLFLAVKPAQSDVPLGEWNEAYIHRDVEAAIPRVPVMEVKTEPEAKVVEEAQVPSVEEVPSVQAAAPEQKPCNTPEPAVEASPEVVPQEEEEQKPEVLAEEEEQEKPEVEEPVLEQEEDAAPVTVKETVTSREVVRVFETITETVKAYATETVAVRVEESSLPVKEEETFAVKEEENIPVNDQESPPVMDEEPLPFEDAQSAPLEDTDSLPLENTKNLVEDSEILEDTDTSALPLDTAPEDAPATEQDL